MHSFRKRRYQEVSESIREHLEEKIEDLLEQGMPRDEAERAARREFGNASLIEQRSREVWQWPRLESLWNDIRQAIRRMGRSPGFVVTVLLTLALAVGANTAVFSVINRVLIRPLSYPQPERLVSVWLNAPGAGGLSNFSQGLRLSPSMYFTFAEHNRSFQSFGVWTTGTASVTGRAQPRQVRTVLVTNGVLQALDVPPAAGRWLSQTDQSPHGARAVMLSYGYWQSHFGGDRSVIGHNITVDALPWEIVGVMPRGFRLVSAGFDVIEPLAFDRNRQILAGFAFQGVARLKSGVSLAQADADIARMVPIWMNSWSNGPHSNPHFYETWRITPALHPLKQEVTGNVGGVLWMVMGTLGIVMLMACANVANLVLVRAEARQQELAIRAALGAGRRRILRELLTENLLLGLMGGELGVGVAYVGLQWLVAAGPADLPRLNEISLDASALVFTLLLSLFSGCLFGLIAAARYAGTGVSLALESAGRTASTSRERHRFRSALVVTQVAMAVVLLVSAGLMIRTLQGLHNIDPGFSHPESLQTMDISIPASLIASPAMVTRVQNEIADKLTAIPGVASASFAGTVPMQGVELNWDLIFGVGRNYAGRIPPLRLFNYVAPGFFRTAGTRLVAGRDLTWAEIYEHRPLVIVSQNLARDLWGSPSAAIGKQISASSNNSSPYEVIGVVQDVRQDGVQEPAPAIVYWPYAMDHPFGPYPPPRDAMRDATFLLRTNQAGSRGLLHQMEKAVWSVNASLPLAATPTMQDLYGQSLARTSFTLVMLGIAGTMALVLGVIGIYGVISYAVSQRTREIGIRLALGAEKNRIFGMVIGEGLRLAAFGVLLGAMTALLLGQVLKSFSQLLYGISAGDPATLVLVSLGLAAVAVLACYLPARRAASIDPMQALRSE